MDEEIQQRVQRYVNIGVLGRLQRMVEETRADLAREDAAVRWLVPALLATCLPYLFYLFLSLA
jgi:hypothetical protein